MYTHGHRHLCYIYVWVPKSTYPCVCQCLCTFTHTHGSTILTRTHIFHLLAAGLIAWKMNTKCRAKWLAGITLAVCGSPPALCMHGAGAPLYLYLYPHIPGLHSLVRRYKEIVNFVSNRLVLCPGCSTPPESLVSPLAALDWNIWGFVQPIHTNIDIQCRLRQASALTHTQTI